MVLCTGADIDRAVDQLWPRLYVRPDSVGIERRVVALVDLVRKFAKVADPFCPVLDPLHERIHVCATVAATDDRLIFETSLRNTVS